MSADEFWKDDPQLFVSYRTSFINKKKREVEEEDYKCWLQGLYVHDGNGKLFARLQQFLANIISSLFKGQKDNTEIDGYPKKPYLELDKDKKEDKKIAKEREIKKARYKEFEDSIQYYGTLKERYLKEKIDNERSVK